MKYVMFFYIILLKIGGKRIFSNMFYKVIDIVIFYRFLLEF